jgi:hypothetical protein
VRARSVATLVAAIPLFCVLLIIGICRISAIRKPEGPVGNLLGEPMASNVAFGKSLLCGRL